MTPSEDLWAELTPLLSHDVSTLIETARGPGHPDELDGEHEIVEAMREAALRVAHLEPRRPRRRGLVGRVVAAKGTVAVGVIAFGVATAAATTGIVASILLPSSDDDGPSPAPPSTTSVTNRDPSGHEPAEQDPRRDRPNVDCEPAATCPAEPGQQSSLPTTKPDEVPAPGTGNASGIGNAETPATPSGNTEAQNPKHPERGHEPAQGHGPPGPPGQPDQGGAPPGQDQAANHTPAPPPGPTGPHPLPPPNARPPVGPPNPAPHHAPAAPA